MSDLSPLSAATALDVERSREMAAAISRALRRAARQARQPAPLIIGGGVPVRRGERAFRLALIVSFAACVLAPALAAGVYWGLIASPQYATEAKFSLRSSDSPGAGMLGGLVGLPASRQAQDTQIIVSYIQSPALLQDLIATANLPAAYSDPAIDYFSRLPPDSPIERFEKYWARRVDVQYEDASGIVTVNVRAFTPEASKAIANAIVRLSESVVNDLADRPRRAALAQARLEMTRAEQALEQATLAMRNARNAEGVLDATVSAQAISNIVSALQLKLIETENALALQAQNAPQAPVYNAEIGNLRREIDAFNGQIAESNGSPSMADHLSALSFAETKLDAARQRYAVATATYQSARLDMETQQSYVIAFLQPMLAQKSTYPRRGLQWLIVAGPALALWGLAAALAVLARDNMAK